MRAHGAAAAIVSAILIAGGSTATGTLTFYFIDVEGGQSTLIVTPAAQSLLVDTGYATDGRDPARILAATRDAGIKQIDYLLITHFHSDHDGGVVELSRNIPVRTFFDHGSSMEDPRPPERLASFKAYQSIRAHGRHIEPAPGDRLPLKGVEAVWVASAAATVHTPVLGAAGLANDACDATAPPPAESHENPRSTGFLLRFGQFRFVDVGDLSGDPLFGLFCPTNLVGPVDLYLVPHHGGADTTYPATFAAVRPRVAIVNNGATKGADGLSRLRRVAGLEDVFQLHRSQREGIENFPDSSIANLDETTGHWIKVEARDDGSFRVTNGRTGVVKSYGKRAISGHSGSGVLANERRRDY